MTQITKRQHYFPVMLLRNHIIETPPFAQGCIFRFDKCTNHEHVNKIQSVAVKTNLYELYTNDGKIDQDNRNYIERDLSVQEHQWKTIFSKINQQEFLTEDEKNILYEFMTVQLLRIPTIIDVASGLVLSLSPIKNKYEADRYAKLASFGFNRSSATNWIFAQSLADFKKYSIHIICSQLPFILNETIPVLGYSPLQCSTQKFVFCPIAKNRCIVLSNCIHLSQLYIDIPNSLVRCLNGRFFGQFGRYTCCSKSICNEPYVTKEGYDYVAVNSFC